MDMGIQFFLNFEDICLIYFSDMGIFQNNQRDMGYWDPPSRASIVQHNNIQHTKVL